MANYPWMLQKSAYKVYRTTGQQSAEFAASFALLVFSILIPLLDLGTLALRWGLAADLVGTYVPKLAVMDKPSQAFAAVEWAPTPKQTKAKTNLQENRLVSLLTRLSGVHTRKIDLELIIDNQKMSGPSIMVNTPTQIPVDWLPEGNNCPCLYHLQLSVKADIEPLFVVPIGGQNIPGLNAPLPVTLTSRAVWENLGRDPLTGQFYLNE